MPDTAQAAPGTSATAPVPSATSQNHTQDPGNSQSHGWIAGAVIGPVAGCAIIAALAFWFIRRSRAQKQGGISGNEQDVATPYTPSSIPGIRSGSASELGDGAQKPQELDATRSFSELPASPSSGPK